MMRVSIQFSSSGKGSHTISAPFSQYVVKKKFYDNIAKRMNDDAFMPRNDPYESYELE